MRIVIEGSPEEIERVLRKLAPRERRQLAPQQPYIPVGPQVVDPIQPMITYPGFPWGTVTTGGLTVGDCVQGLTIGDNARH